MQPTQARTITGSALFVDVREADEYEAGHVEGSAHIPIGEIQARWQELLGHETVVVACQIGQRSGLVTDYLREKGLDAHNLEGGLEAWSRAGLPLTSGSGAGLVVDGFARDLSGRRITPSPRLLR
jgi:rhodanese-related sulfurtransferase